MPINGPYGYVTCSPQAIRALHAALVRYRQWLEAATRKEESAGWDASDSDIVLESALAAFDQAVTL